MEGKTYEDGIKYAWNLMKKFILPFEDGGFSDDNLKEMFHTADVMDIVSGFTVEDIIEKVEQFNENKTLLGGEIVVDEDGKYGIVLAKGEGDDDEHRTLVYGNLESGKVALNSIRKTGEILDISDIFDDIKNGL